jgi:hypothetical protein
MQMLRAPPARGARVQQGMLLLNPSVGGFFVFYRMKYVIPKRNTQYSLIKDLSMRRSFLRITPGGSHMKESE